MRWGGLVILILCAYPIQAAQISRKVLALYEGHLKETSHPADHEIHPHLEGLLNRLGIAVDHHDISQGPPTDLSPYRGLILWNVDNNSPDPEGVIETINLALDHELKLLIIGGLGVDYNLQGGSPHVEKLKKLNERMGISTDNDTYPLTANPMLVQMEDTIPEAFGFETDLFHPSLAYKHLTVTAPDATIWRMIKRSDIPGSLCPAIFTAPWGGWITQPQMAMVRVNEGDGYISWDLDIQRFLRETFDLSHLPRACLATRHGIRVAYAHIDGDGFRNGTWDLPGKPTVSGEVVYRDILKKYPVPTGVSYIIVEIDEQHLGSPELLDLARKIARLPQVELASHAYTHPFNWHRGVVAFPIKGYTFDPVKETAGAINRQDELLALPNKKTKVFYWSGDCRPQPEAMQGVISTGSWNINNGNSQQDNDVPGIDGLQAYGLFYAGNYQVYASNANENPYTNGWLRNYSGFGNVVKTFENTESPRTLPVNIYYHFYSGERLAALAGLQKAYNWTTERELCWVFPSTYCQMANDERTYTLEKVNDTTWKIGNITDTIAMSFPMVAGIKSVDLASSTGVRGFTELDGRLLVDCSGPATVVLSQIEQTIPYVRGATNPIRSFTREASAVQVEMQVFQEGFIEFGGLPKSQPMTASIDGHEVLLATDSGGNLRLPVSAAQGQWKEIRCDF